MGHAAVENVGTGNAAADAVHAALQLGDHAAGNDAFLDEGGHLGHMHHMDEGVFILGVAQDAAHIGEQDELFRFEGHGQLGGGGVGVDVVAGLAVHAHGHGGYHRDVVVFQCEDHRVWVDLFDRADQAVAGVLLDGLEQAVIHAGQADGLAAHAVQRGHKVFVHPAAEHLLDDVHGLVVGVAQAVHEFGLLAHLAQHLVDLRAAAVDNDHMNADQMEQNDVAHDCVAQLVGNHGVAAVFDDHGLAVEFLNIGQGFDQDLSSVNVGKGHWGAS